MPIFRLNKAFNVGRDAKVFLNLQGGLTRGPVPESAPHEDQADILRKERQRNEKQRKLLLEQRLEISQLKSKLGAANGSTEDALEAAPPASQEQDEPKGALPEFIVIGAMRCGTSQFYGLLTQHPNVKKAAAKELHYFDRPERFEKGIEWYRKCFPAPQWNDGRKSITGEATPKYLSDPLVPERVFGVVPEARLIALLRNPVDRVYSHYHLLARRGYAPSFEEALESEQPGLLEAASEPPGHEPRVSSDQKPATKLLTKGLYVDQLMLWHQFFSKDQLLILKSEDFYKHTADTLNNVQDFLGLPQHKLELPPRGKSSRSTEYRYEPMNPNTKKRLEKFYEPYNQRLYEYLGTDFEW